MDDETGTLVACVVRMVDCAPGGMKVERRSKVEGCEPDGGRGRARLVGEVGERRFVPFVVFSSSLTFPLAALMRAGRGGLPLRSREDLLAFTSGETSLGGVMVAMPCDTFTGETRGVTGSFSIMVLLLGNGEFRRTGGEFGASLSNEEGVSGDGICIESDGPRGRVFVTSIELSEGEEKSGAQADGSYGRGRPRLTPVCPPEVVDFPFDGLVPVGLTSGNERSRSDGGFELDLRKADCEIAPSLSREAAERGGDLATPL